VLVYVDDLMILGNNNVVIKAFQLRLNTWFYMKDLGVFCWNIFWIFRWFVTLLTFSCDNINVHWISISYLKYDHLEAKHVCFPMDQHRHLHLVEGTLSLSLSLSLDVKHYYKTFIICVHKLGQFVYATSETGKLEHYPTCCTLFERSNKPREGICCMLIVIHRNILSVI